MHQSQYIPWPPYFRKMAQADIFILMDCVQYQKNGVQNRNMINSANGAMWLTIPVSGSIDQAINQKLPVNDIWRKKHVQSIRSSYARAPYFSRYFDTFAELIMSSGPDLHSINYALINVFRQLLAIDNKLILLSELNIQNKKNQLVVDSCVAVGADLYVSGAGAVDYLDVNSFISAGIKVGFLANEMPVYCHNHLNETKGLSMLDWLMHDDINNIKHYLHKPMELRYD
uniref:WbqC-like protein n=1 Tax=Rheinheimera sp. BAL341 TaxID=1708203 RepID=A0A486XVW2_9GAMM